MKTLVYLTVCLKGNSKKDGKPFEICKGLVRVTQSNGFNTREVNVKYDATLQSKVGTIIECTPSMDLEKNVIVYTA